MTIKTVTLWEQNWNTHAQRPDNLSDYIAWLTNKLNEIPAKYRESARVETEAEPSYEGSAVLVYKILYDRPETNGERIAREESERRRQKEKEAYDRREFERLKTKFGGQV